MVVSYIINTYNRKEILRRHLGMLLEQTYQGPLEVLVCVDGSTDGTQEMLAAWPEYPRYTFQWFDTGSTEVNTAAKSRNNGLRAATGEMVIFIDEDCLPHRELIASYVRDYEPRRIQLGYKSSKEGYLTLPLPVPIEDGNMATWWRDWQNGSFAHFQTGTCALALEAARIKAKDGNNGFDERFIGYGHEDSELGQRLYRAGYKPYFNRDAVVWHMNPSLCPQQPRERKLRESAESDRLLKQINREPWNKD